MFSTILAMTNDTPNRYGSGLITDGTTQAPTLVDLVRHSELHRIRNNGKTGSDNSIEKVNEYR